MLDVINHLTLLICVYNAVPLAVNICSNLFPQDVRVCLGVIHLNGLNLCIQYHDVNQKVPRSCMLPKSAKKCIKAPDISVICKRLHYSFVDT